MDGNGNAYIVGMVYGTIPTTVGAFQTARSSQDSYNSLGFVVKLNGSGVVSYGTYLGGATTNNTSASAVAVDGNGNAYVVGTTLQSDFPVTPGALSTTFGGGGDAFAAKLNSAGSALAYGTYLGGTSQDAATAVAIDSSGNAYITGTTSSTNFPTTAEAFSTTRTSIYYYGTGFVSKLNAAGSTLLYSTYLGGSSSDAPSGLVVNGSGDAIIAGTTSSADFPTTPGALKQKTSSIYNYSSDPDGFVSELNPTGESLVYSTLFGSSSSDSIAGVAADGTGVVYVAGQTMSLIFPATPNAYQISSKKTAGTSNAGSAFVSKIDLTSPVTCNIVLSSNAVSVPGHGATGSFTFTVASGCPWEVTNDSFITVGSPTHGFGNGTVNYTVAYNQSTYSTQTGTIVVNGGTLVAGTNVFTVNQALGSCSDPVFDSSQITFDPAGGLHNVAVSLPTNCAWNVMNASPWVTITSGAAGTGTGTLSLYAAPNSFPQRQGTVTVATKPISVTQGGGTCTVTLGASSISVGAQGGTGAMPFTASSAACTWTAYSLAPWIQINSTASSGQGSGSAPFVVAANPGTLARTGQLNIGNQFYTVTQAAGPAFNATAYTQSTVAGNGSYGFSGDGGPALSASFYSPGALAFDTAGNLYVADTGNARIRVIDPTGNINTFAGGGSANPGDGGSATAATLAGPRGVAADAAGNVYFSDGQRIRIVQNGLISTYAGTGTAGFSGDMGPPTAAMLNGPAGIALDSTGNLYIADQSNSRVREISGGLINTIAGTGTQGYNGDNIAATTAELITPYSVAVDSSTNIYIGDGSCRIRKVATSGLITTAAGTGTCGEGPDGVSASSSQVYDPNAIATDAAGSLYIGELYRIRKVTPDGIIRTIFTLNSITVSGFALDPSGDLFFSMNGFIERLTPTPSFCSYTVTPPTKTPLTGGSVTIQVTTAAGCTWSAASILPWATLTGPSTVTGSGSVTFTVAAGAGRTGTVTVAGQNVTLTQLTSSNAGIFRQGFLWVLDVDGNERENHPAVTTCTPSAAFPGDIPITGDWNGDGRTKIGIYRSSNGLWILDTNGNGVIDAGDAVFNLHIGTSPGDIPVVGDWNGDGRSKVGYFRQGFLWILDTNGNHTYDQSDQVYAFGGIAGDVPVVGDWTGTGTSKIGIFRQGFLWILDANGNGTH